MNHIIQILSLKTAIENYDGIENSNSKKYLILGDMLELGKHSLKQHRLMSEIINKTRIHKVYVIGRYKRDSTKGLIKKKAQILNDKSNIIDLINNNLNNNDYLMIKGSNSTGLNKLTNNLKQEVPMLYELLLNYIDTFSFLNVFKYITFRTGLAFFTSLLIALAIGGPFIRLFSNRKIFDPIREDGPTEHIVKKIGTPTMGGVIILTGLIISVLFWADLSNVYILFCLYIVSSFGLLGAYDDYKKITSSNSSGISFKFKLIMQILLALFGLIMLTYFVEYESLKSLFSISEEFSNQFGMVFYTFLNFCNCWFF